MRVGNYIPYVINSTGVLNLVQTPLTLANAKIVIANNDVNQTITFYDASGSIIGQSLHITSSTEIKLKFSDISMISFSDTNNYSIIAFVQIVKFDSIENYLEYTAEADISIIPINSVQIVNPLDANGNVKVNVEASIPPPYHTYENIIFIQETLQTANTPQSINAGIFYNFMIMYNPNSDTIYFGDSNNQPIPIPSGSSYTLYAHLSPVNGGSVYWKSATAGDVLWVMYA